MQPGKPIIGEDAVVFIDRTTDTTMIVFEWTNLAITGEVDVFLVIDNRIKKLVDLTNYDIVINKEKYSEPTEPSKRAYVVPASVPYTVRYYFTRSVHVEPYKKKYPVFKFRIEMVGNPSIFAETNDFKVVY